MTDLRKRAEEIVLNGPDVYGETARGVYVKWVTKQILQVDKEAHARGREEAIRECAEEVPTNWLDPLLTGPRAVIKDAPCPEIEALLLGVRKEILSLLDKAPLGGKELIKERDAYRKIAIDMALNHEWAAGSVELAEVTVDRKAKNLLERKGKKA